MRSHFRHIATDAAGDCIQNAKLFLYQAGTTTAVTDAWSAASGGSPVTYLITNNQGEAECWFDTPQAVDVKITDNTDTAYYPSTPTAVLSWSDFTERVPVLVPPERLIGLPANVVEFGAKGDGSTNDAAAIQSAIDSLPATGGTVFFPAGDYHCSSGLDLDDKRSIVFVGPGAPTAGAQPTSRLTYTGSGSGRFISVRSSAGFQVRGMAVGYSNAAYTGSLISYAHSALASDSAFGLIEDGLIFGPLTAGQTAVLLDWDKAIFCRAVRTHFLGGGTAIRGANGASYSNANAVESCTFSAQGVIPIANPGDTWAIWNDAFEGLQDGSAGAVTCAITSVSLSILNNFCGDTAGGQWFSLNAQGLHFAGNSLSACAVGLSLDVITGGVVEGNRFYNLTTAIAVGGSGSVSGLSIGPNYYNTVTNRITGTLPPSASVNISEGSTLDFIRHYGPIELPLPTTTTPIPTGSTEVIHVGGVTGSERGVSAFGDGSGFNYRFKIRTGARAAEVLLSVEDAYSDGTTALMIADNQGGTRTLKRVNTGAADSGGTGQRLLTVAN